MYAGVSIMNYETQVGLQMRKRNPKKKARLPYHAKKNLDLPIVGRTETFFCLHALATHEEINNGRPNAISTVSYAMACVSKHSSKKVQHRDITGRKWQ